MTMADIQRLKSFAFLIVLGGIWVVITYLLKIQPLWIKWGIFGQFATVGVLILIPFPEDFSSFGVLSLLIALEGFVLAAIDISFKEGHLGLFGSLEMSLGMIFLITHFTYLTSKRGE